MQDERLKDVRGKLTRVPEANFEALSDRELWEYIVTRALPEGDAFAAADWIFEKHKNLGRALYECERLMHSTPVVETICRELRIMLEVCCRVSRARLTRRSAIRNHDEIIDYCKARMAHLDREQLRLLCFDARYRLIADEIQQTGTVNHVAAYPREIALRSLDFGAAAIVLAHNHPSGDPTPSQSDIHLTRTIIQCLEPLGIKVLDHVIIARDLNASFRRLGLLEGANNNRLR
ncbi:JAB domain-containing protein [Rhodoligotrophos defluvii]|uniref:JAB domain-containing protein n=1 Tax=Rhodoligotrophos defluvii TaxID=2561934 RepID=UPI0010C9F348|nr:DNA repair protein RadC [Rhodoligotrophos defluvii]